MLVFERKKGDDGEFNDESWNAMVSGFGGVGIDVCAAARNSFAPILLKIRCRERGGRALDAPRGATVLPLPGTPTSRCRRTRST